jgi:hypothetical protein
MDIAGEYLFNDREGDIIDLLTDSHRRDMSCRGSNEKGNLRHQLIFRTVFSIHNVGLGTTVRFLYGAIPRRSKNQYEGRHE